LLPDGSPLGRLRNRLLTYVADNVVFGSVNKAARESAQRAGMPFYPIKPMPSPYLTLQPSVPELEYPHEALDRTVHFIGALLPEAQDFTPPSWWEQVVKATKPVVLVTQGTVATNADELIKPALAGLAAEDAIVIATTGGKTAAELGLTVPANARVETFVPFVPLMPHVDVFITNGGYGGFVVAMAHGVPIIAGGVSEDKVEVNNRLVYTGAGINLKTATPTPEQVRDAFRRIISEPSFKQKAAHIQTSFAAKDAPIEGTNLLEELIRRRTPILNGRG
jgi:UDP:flavonoid glycosyltransferase YjiC (YdhE family)